MIKVGNNKSFIDDSLYYSKIWSIGRFPAGGCMS